MLYPKKSAKLAGALAAMVLLPASAAAADYVVASSVVPGRYACLEFKGNRAIEYGHFTGVKFSNEFEIVDGGKYVYRGTKPRPGTYQFDRGSGQLRWTSGPFAPDADGSSIDALSAIRPDGKPLIILTFHIPRFPDSKEWCALVGK